MLKSQLADCPHRSFWRRPMLKIRDLTGSHRAGPYALEAERKMGQLLKLAKKNTGPKGIGPICHPWFTPVYSGSTRKTAAVETDGAVHSGYFFPLAWSTAAFSSGSLTSDKVRSNIWPPIFRRT